MINSPAGLSSPKNVMKRHSHAVHLWKSCVDDRILLLSDPMTQAWT